MSTNPIKYFSTGEFARLCNVHKKTLFHYDEINLFKPEKIMDNGYRYYSQNQLEVFNVIYTLKEIGMPLKAIKIFMDERTPQKVIELFEHETEQIEKEIENLKKKQQLMATKIKLIKEGLVSIGPLQLEEQGEEYLILSAPIQETDIDYDIETYTKHVDYCTKEQLAMGYLPGAIIKKQYLEAHEFSCYSYYFSKVDREDFREGMKIKPQGLYAVGHFRGYYDKSYAMYKELMKYIKEHGLSVTGDAYEEVLIDEVSVKEREDYRIKISIAVKKG